MGQQTLKHNFIQFEVYSHSPYTLHGTGWTVVSDTMLCALFGVQFSLQQFLINL